MNTRTVVPSEYQKNLLKRANLSLPDSLPADELKQLVRVAEERIRRVTVEARRIADQGFFASHPPEKIVGTCVKKKNGRWVQVLSVQPEYGTLMVQFVEGERYQTYYFHWSEFVWE